MLYSLCPIHAALLPQQAGLTGRVYLHCHWRAGRSCLLLLLLGCLSSRSRRLGREVEEDGRRGRLATGALQL